jgi:hypothetical protein
MTQQHPITPPPELVQQWDCEWREQQNAPVIGWSANLLAYVATRAAQWGADQELEACCEEMKSIPSPLGIPFGEMASNALRNARRPTPPSLKEQALQALNDAVIMADDAPPEGIRSDQANIIRRALEQLND